MSDTPTFIPLILLIGLPGSGKSTLAARLVQENLHWQLVSTDGIRSTLFGDAAVQGPWGRVWREVGQQFRQTVEQIASGDRTTGLYDATNAVRKQRRDAIALARESGFTHLTAIWLHTPLETCLQRNAHRDRQVPLEVILHMHRSLVDVPPDRAEGLDAVIEMR